LMQRDLISRILHNELRCAGVRVSPTRGKGPEQIPKHVFSKPDIDWNNSTVRAFTRAIGRAPICSSQPRAISHFGSTHSRGMPRLSGARSILP
jgi:hypothetical protein